MLTVRTTVLRLVEELANMSATDDQNRYHIPKEATQPVEDRIRQASRRELEKWSDDPNCFEMELCAKEFARRQSPSEPVAPAPEPYPGYSDALKSSGAREQVQAVWGVADQRPTSQWQDNSFNPRTEVSADAKYIASRIVKHLWIIFVILPFVAAVLLMIAGVIK
jgi:hypothetical protein